MHPQKGVETFLRAAARVPEPHQLLLAGEGEELGRMQGLAAQLGLRATFMGKVEHSRLPLVYGAADVCVVPSHYESFGMVALEAMACGRPVVASAVGGLRYNVVDGRTGLLAPARDEAAFARCMQQLLVDRALREDLGRSAASYVSRDYTWRAVADSLASVYEQVQAA
jgi:glycosyltransferase involved in cell wall biosynthesis